MSGSVGRADFSAQAFCFRAAPFGFDHAGFGPPGTFRLPSSFARGFGEVGEFFLPRGFGQFFFEAGAGESAVLRLGAGIHRRDDEPGREVLERDGSRNLVHVLAAGPARPVENLHEIFVAEPDHADEFHAEFEISQDL